MQICPACGTANPERARFCMACGTPLGAGSSGEERRLVTVLFADIAGFTARFERADPEDISAALRPFHTRLKQEIESFGGTVDKFAGDVVFGVFGAPIAREDDAERAVRAALKIRDWAHERSEADAARTLGIRVGISTGEAMVAGGQGPLVGERVTGDVVNTASRLQSTAAPDSIVVGESTFQSIETQFRWDPLGSVSVKGKAEPVRIWSPLAPIARIGVEPPDPQGAPFVGRAEELGILRERFQEVVRDRRPRLVVIVGEAGVGKSRLIAELFGFTDALPELIRWRVGRPDAFGDTGAFAPLGEIVKGEAGILDSDPPEAVAERLAAVMRRAIPDEDECARLDPHLSALVTGDTPEADVSRDEAFAAWASFLELLAVENPTVLTFEDMHAASEPLLAFIESILERDREAPILLLLAARPEVEDLKPDWAGRSDTVTIRLAPLSPAETAALVGSLHTERPLAPGLHRTVVERAGGNPLYAEEFVRMLDEGPRRADEDEVAVPPTIHGLLASRLDAMPRPLKAAAQDASVVGAALWPGALAAMSGRTEAQAVDDLEALAERQLVRRTTASSVEGQTEYAFRHILLRDVAYGQIPRAERAHKHRAVASWLEEAIDPGSADRADRLAFHYAEAHGLAGAAGDMALAEDMAAPAIEHLLAAGRRASHLDAPHALSLYRRALAMMPADHPDRAGALRAAGVAAQETSAFDEAEEHLRAAMDLFAASGEAAKAADAKVLLARSLFERGDVEAVAPLLTQAVRSLATLPPGPEYAHAASRVAGHLWVMGDYRRCIRWADRALKLARELDLPREEVLALQYRGASRSKTGDAGGLTDLRDALRTGRDRGLGEEAAVAYNNYAYELWFHRGSWASIEAWEEMEAFCEERGLANSSAWARGGLLEPLFDVGAWDRALSIAAGLRAWDADHGGVTPPGAVALTYQGWISLRRGDVDRAAVCAAELMDHASHLSTVEYLIPARLLHAEVSAAMDDLPQTRSHLEAFLAATEDQPIDRLGAAPLLARLLVQLGDAPRASALLGPEADEAVTSERVRLGVDTGRAVAAEAQGDHEDAMASYERTARRWDTHGFPVETALCSLGAGRCAAALGRSADAVGWFLDARSTFEALGARPWLDEVDRAEREVTSVPPR